jgi:hypothetical protein
VRTVSKVLAEKTIERQVSGRPGDLDLDERTLAWKGGHDMGAPPPIEDGYSAVKVRIDRREHLGADRIRVVDDFWEALRVYWMSTTSRMVI